ncbi:hypothetical protein HO551_04260 [Streptococcus suis]|nr:hypothetical protein [Streptococcus suis]NQJ52116.1 hypothetical protein [Streptococcus suis]NQJ56470.1 hypothetical protein [Streptococcus suis]HEM6059937.1 hypothetical protein [Streptococcus suis]
MNGYLKLDKMLDWQVANYPLRMSEKARLMALPGDDFVAELDRMADEYHRTRYEGESKWNNLTT